MTAIRDVSSCRPAPGSSTTSDHVTRRTPPGKLATGASTSLRGGGALMPQPAAPRMVVPSSAAPRLRRLTGEAVAMRKVLFEWDAMSRPVAEEKAGRIAVELVEDLRHLVEGVARLEDQRGQIRQRGVRKPIHRLAGVAPQPVGLIEQPAGCRDIGAQAADKFGKGWPVVGDDAVHVGRDIGEAAH